MGNTLERSNASYSNVVLLNLVHMFLPCSCYMQADKDQRIRELTLELSNERQRCKRRCAAYQEQLHMVLRYIEEHTDHMSRRVQDIVQNVRELEEEEQQDSDL